LWRARQSRRSAPALEQFKFFCGRPGVAEDKAGKDAEAGNATALSMQADAAG